MAGALVEQLLVYDASADAVARTVDDLGEVGEVWSMASRWTLFCGRRTGNARTDCHGP